MILFQCSKCGEAFNEATSILHVDVYTSSQWSVTRTGATVIQGRNPREAVEKGADVSACPVCGGSFNTLMRCQGCGKTIHSQTGLESLPISLLRPYWCVDSYILICQDCAAHRSCSSCSYVRSCGVPEALGIKVKKSTRKTASVYDNPYFVMDTTATTDNVPIPTRISVEDEPRSESLRRAEARFRESLRGFRPEQGPPINPTLEAVDPEEQAMAEEEIFGDHDDEDEEDEQG